MCQYPSGISYLSFDTFEVKVGVKQDCALVPTLFTVYLATVLYSFRRVKATTMTQTATVFGLEYATFLSNTAERLQRTFSIMTNIYNNTGLKINARKTEVPHITLKVGAEDVKTSP